MYEKITALFLACSTALSADVGQFNNCDACLTLSSAYPKAHLNLGVDFLAWKICQSDLSYAFEAPPSPPSPETLTYFGKREYIDLDWEAGFRVHAGYQFGCDGFVLNASYTFFHPTSNGKIRPKECNILLLDQGYIKVLDQVGAAYEEIAWYTKHDYNVFDLLFSRPTCVSQTYVVTPYFGARGFWLNQEFEFSGSYFNTPFSVNHVGYTSDFSGGGLHAGMRHEMLFCGCLAIYGDLGASIIAGKAEDKLEQIFEDCKEKCYPYVEVDDDYCCCMPGIDLALGINWSSDCKCYFVKVNLGYEMSYWWNVPTLRRYSNTISIPEERIVVSDRGTSAMASTLLAHGVTLNASIYF